MANRPPKKPDPAEIEKLDLDPDAWAKFEGLVKSAAQLGPKPHSTDSAGAKKPPKRKG